MKMRSRPKVFLLLIGLLLLCLISGCMFKDLKKEIQEEQSSYGIIGRVEGTTRAKGNVFVLLYAKKDGRMELERFTLPDETGIFSFIVNQGTYLLAAHTVISQLDS